MDRSAITWTSMLTAYAQNEQPDEAMTLVIKVIRLGLRPNNVIYNTLPSSFSGPNYLDYCKQVHLFAMVVESMIDFSNLSFTIG